MASGSSAVASAAPIPPLRAIVAQAYRLFAPYTVGASLHGCNCNVCMSKENERKLARTPLRDISAARLAEYTNSAHAWDDPGTTSRSPARCGVSCRAIST